MFFSHGGPTFWEMMQQAASSTQRGYDLLAAKFDKSVFRTPECIVASMEESLKRRGPYQDGLDVGCGTGALTELLLRVCQRRVVGLDMSEGMLDRARDQCHPHHDGQRIDFWQGDLLRLESQGQFDVATCFGVFGHLLPEDHPEMLRRVHRALRPGGKFVTVLSHFPKKTRWLYWVAWLFDNLMRLRNLIWRPTFVMYYLTFPLEKASRMMEQTGFSVEVVDDLFPAPFSQLKLVVATRS